MRESLDHRPAGWIRQSRKCCTQFIHNHMVVDCRSLSSVNFAIRDFCPVSLTPTPALIDTLRRRASRQGLWRWPSGAGGMRIVFGIFSVSHRPVGQVIFARRLARTCAVSEKSPMHSSKQNKYRKVLVSRNSGILIGPQRRDTWTLGRLSLLILAGYRTRPIFYDRRWRKDGTQAVRDRCEWHLFARN